MDIQLFVIHIMSKSALSAQGCSLFILKVADKSYI